MINNMLCPFHSTNINGQSQASSIIIGKSVFIKDQAGITHIWFLSNYSFKGAWF